MSVLVPMAPINFKVTTMMKKILWQLCVLCVLGVSSTSALADIRVFTCEPELEALVKTLGGDKVTVSVATHAKQDVHHIQARPSLINKVRRADMVVCTGASLEVGWLPVLLKKGANPAVQKAPGLFMAAEHVDLLGQVEVVDRSKGDVHPEGNPHAFQDPNRLLLIAEALAERLAVLDSDNKAYYVNRFADFKGRWLAAIAEWEKKAAPLKGKGVVVHHKSWGYFLNWLGMNMVASIEPLPGIPPTTSHLSKLVKKMESEPAYAIVRAPYTDKKGSLWLSKRTNICVVELAYTVGGSKQALDLFGLFDSMIDQLLEAKDCQ